MKWPLKVPVGKILVAVFILLVAPSRFISQPALCEDRKTQFFDRRHRVDINAAPWHILGRLQTELGGRCTAFVVAPNVVITAAHCLWISDAAHYLRPHSVHFLRAYLRGRYKTEAVATRFIIAPGFDPVRPIATAQADRATIILDRAVMSASDLLPTFTPKSGDDAALAGYEQDRREVAIGDLQCHILSVSGNIIKHDCVGKHGASGAPILIKRPYGWGIGGIETLADPDGGGAGVIMK